MCYEVFWLVFLIKMVITSICFAIIFRMMVSFLHYKFLSKRIAYASKQELLFRLFDDILLYKIDYRSTTNYLKLLSDEIIWLTTYKTTTSQNSCSVHCFIILRLPIPILASNAIDCILKKY